MAGNAFVDALAQYEGHDPAPASDATSVDSPGANWLGEMRQLAQQHGLVVTSTTGGTHVPTSYHYSGHAVDVSGPPSNMAAFAQHVRSQYGPDLKELFYDPLGGWKNGQSIGAIGGHSNHVHVAWGGDTPTQALLTMRGQGLPSRGGTSPALPFVDALAKYEGKGSDFVSALAAHEGHPAASPTDAALRAKLTQRGAAPSLPASAEPPPVGTPGSIWAGPPQPGDVPQTPEHARAQVARVGQQMRANAGPSLPATPTVHGALPWESVAGPNTWDPFLRHETRPRTAGEKFGRTLQGFTSFGGSNAQPRMDANVQYYREGAQQGQFAPPPPLSTNPVARQSQLRSLDQAKQAYETARLRLTQQLQAGQDVLPTGRPGAAPQAADARATLSQWPAMKAYLQKQGFNPNPYQAQGIRAMMSSDLVQERDPAGVGTAFFKGLGIDALLWGLAGPVGRLMGVGAEGAGLGARMLAASKTGAATLGPASGLNYGITTPHPTVAGGARATLEGAAGGALLGPPAELLHTAGKAALGLLRRGARVQIPHTSEPVTVVDHTPQGVTVQADNGVVVRNLPPEQVVPVEVAPAPAPKPKRAPKAPAAPVQPVESAPTPPPAPSPTPVAEVLPEPSVVPTEPALAAREPWQMTREEFSNTATVNRGNNYVAVRSPHDDTSFIIRTLDTSKYTDADAIAKSHESYIDKALAKGRPVPPEVLAEYPDLAAKAPAEAPKEAPANDIERQARQEFDPKITALQAKIAKLQPIVDAPMETPGSFVTGRSNRSPSLDRRLNAENERKASAFRDLQAAKTDLARLQQHREAFVAGEVHLNGQPRADAPSRVQRTNTEQEIADFHRSRLNPGDRVALADNPKNSIEVKRVNAKSVTDSNGETWKYPELALSHPDGTPLTREEITAAYRTWKQNAAGEASPRYQITEGSNLYPFAIRDTQTGRLAMDEQGNPLQFGKQESANAALAKLAAGEKVNSAEVMAKPAEPTLKAGPDALAEWQAIQKRLQSAADQTKSAEGLPTSVRSRKGDIERTTAKNTEVLAEAAAVDAERARFLRENQFVTDENGKAVPFMDYLSKSQTEAGQTPKVYLISRPPAEVAPTAEAQRIALQSSAEVQQAIADWKSGRAYLDNAGNYRLKPVDDEDRVTGNRGPIASWNKTAKAAFKDTSELSAAAGGKGAPPRTAPPPGPPKPQTATEAVASPPPPPEVPAPNGATVQTGPTPRPGTEVPQELHAGPGALFGPIIQKASEIFGKQPAEARIGKAGGLGTALRNFFYQNLSGLGQVSPEGKMAVQRLGASASQAGQLMRRGWYGIYDALGANRPILDQFHSYLLESNLRGLRQRFYDLADEAGRLSDADATGKRGEELIDMMRNVDKHVGQVRSQVQGPLSGHAEQLHAAGDAQGVRDVLTDAFNAAGAQVHSVPSMNGGPTDFATFGARPEVQKALQVYKDTFEAPLRESHLLNEGVLRDQKYLGPADAYYPLVALDTTGAPVGSASGGNRLFPWMKPRNPRNQFATGLGKDYASGGEHFQRAVSGAIYNNNRANALSVLENEGIIQPIKGGRAPETIKIGGVEYPVTEMPAGPSRLLLQDGKAIPVGGKRYAVPTPIFTEINEIIQGDPMRQAAAFDRLHKAVGVGVEATFLSTVEAVTHGSNLIGTTVGNTPFIGETLFGKAAGNTFATKLFNVVQTGMRINPSTPENVVKLEHLAKIGALPAKTGGVTYSPEYAEVTGAEHKPVSLSPLLYGPSGIDTRARILMYDVAKKMDPNISDHDLAQFVNQLGAYNKALNSSLQNILGQYAPFYEAGKTMSYNALKVANPAAAAGIGPKMPVSSGLPKTAQFKYQAQQQISAGLAVALASWAMAYKQNNGKWPSQDPEAKLGYLKLNPQQRRSALAQKIAPGTDPFYINILAGDPLAGRGARLTGLRGTFESYNVTRNPGQAAEHGLADILSTGAGPVTNSPWIRAASVLGTGNEPSLTGLRDRHTGRYGAQWRPGTRTRAPGFPQAFENTKAAALEFNPIAKQVFGMDADRDGKRTLLRAGIDMMAPTLLYGPQSNLRQYRMWQESAAGRKADIRARAKEDNR